MTILVTGASGFVGQYLCDFLSQKKVEVVKGSVRNSDDIESIDLTNVDVVIHLAGLVHQMQGAPEKDYFQSNYEVTRYLADKAKESGVKQFIFISTVKVYGENSTNTVLDESSDCLPEDAYGRSKLQAEQYLTKLIDTSFKVAVLRLPLVYGPNVKGNFINLLALHAEKKIIPFKNISTRRSMVFVGNVCALIEKIMDYKGEQVIFIAADSLDTIPLSELSIVMIKSLGRKNVLFCKLPIFCQRIIQFIKPHLFQRLFQHFTFNTERTFSELGYTPMFSLDTAMKETCQWYVENKVCQ